MNGKIKERYSRQIVISEIGEEGQEKLGNSSVLVIGCGGLGSPAAIYLASSGIGRIGLVDDDIVSISNLQRQILHYEKDIGKSKVESASKSIKDINSKIIIDKYDERLTEINVHEIFSHYDFIIDATDNFKSKFLINDTCVNLGKPFVHAGVMGFNGQVMTYIPNAGPCYRCIFGNIPEDDLVKRPDMLGILGTVTGIIGSIEATEAIKYLLGIGDLLIGRLLTFDALKMSFREIKLPDKSENCTACR